MEHALIIGADGPEAESAARGLWDADYQSIMRVEDPIAAISALGDFHPNLIMVLPRASSSASIAALEQLSELAGAPVIVATSDVDQALDCLGPNVSLEGPFAIDAVRQARDAALAPPAMRHAA